MTGAVHMGMKDKVTVKLLQATSDKKALQWKKSFVEVNKILGTSSPKKKKNK
jgi:hypothetical protein